MDPVPSEHVSSKNIYLTKVVDDCRTVSYQSDFYEPQTLYKLKDPVCFEKDS